MWSITLSTSWDDSQMTWLNTCCDHWITWPLTSTAMWWYHDYWIIYARPSTKCKSFNHCITIKFSPKIIHIKLVSEKTIKILTAETYIPHETMEDVVRATTIYEQDNEYCLRVRTLNLKTTQLTIWEKPKTQKLCKLWTTDRQKGKPNPRLQFAYNFSTKQKHIYHPMVFCHPTNHMGVSHNFKQFLFSFCL